MKSHYRIEKHTPAVGFQFSALRLLVLVALIAVLPACSSPPKLSQVQCCVARPINSDEWIAAKRKEFEGRMRVREADTDSVRAANAHPRDDAAVGKDFDEKEKFDQASKSAQELIEAAKEVPPQQTAKATDEKKKPEPDPEEDD